MQYCTANNINDETDKSATKRRAILLTTFVEETYRVAKDLIFPEVLDNVEFHKLVEILTKHFLPKRCTFSERFNFYKAEQRAGEDLVEWAARVRHLAQFCGFGSELETALRDRFVLGLENVKEKEKLFAEDIATLSFSKALELAQSVHCAHIALKSTRVGNTRGEMAELRETSTHPCFAMKTNMVSNKTAIITKFCEVCGYRNHTKDNCRFINATCKKCNKKGHLIRMCKVKAHSNNYLNTDDIENLEGNYNLFNIEKPCKDKPILRSVLLGGKHIKCEIDCGSAVSVLPTRVYKDFFDNSNYCLQSCNDVFKFYTGVEILPEGCLSLPVTFEGRTMTIKFFVITTKVKRSPLLGRDFMKLFNLQVSSWECNNIKVSESDGEMLMKKYYQLLSDELGTFNKYKVSLKIKPDAQLRFFKARPVPLALKPKVEQELNKMVDLGILEKIDYSDVATPIVPVLKPDGSVRICGDFSVTLNKVLYLDNYTLPRIEELFAKLHGGISFSKLDMSRAYSQLELDESKKLTCINTHKGLYRYNRLVFGLANAPFIFQRTMEQLLGDIEGVCIYLDDILVTASDNKTHLNRLDIVLRRLQEAGLRLKRDKCELFKSSVEYLGFVIDKDGLHKSKKKVEAILQCNSPKNVTELKSFLGMVNYYRCFVPETSSVLSPLHSLLKKDIKWTWGREQDSAFKKIKLELASDRVLAHYSPEYPTIVTCDAGPVGLGAVLSQRQPDGSERVVAYASRSLSKAELNYAQIQKEATSIVFVIKKFHHYLYGRTVPFILRTDHKPLLSIFGKKQGVPVLAANRLQRYALFLTAYNFHIEYVKSEDNVADFLSRSVDSSNETTNDCKDETLYINFIGDSLLPPITVNDIKQETQNDEQLKVVSEFIRKGWPSKIYNEIFKPYFLCRHELSLEDGCVLRGHKIVIPSQFRERILNELHNSHFGVVRTKTEARSRMWWPNIDRDIEEKIGSCSICNTLRHNPPQAPLASWPYPESAWERVHLDMFMLCGQQYLIAVDAYSKWLECFLMQKYDTEAIISKLSEMFSRFGLVHTLVTDNASNFCSNDFESFCCLNGIKHLTIAPYHPASNGQAENSVKTVKKGLQAIVTGNNNPNVITAKLNKFLFDYRNCVHLTTGFSPAQMMLGRPLRCRLDLLRVPEYTNMSLMSNAAKYNVIQKQNLQSKQFGGTRNLNFRVGDRVLVKYYFNNGNKFTWKLGTLERRIGSRMFAVFIPEICRVVKKHVDQILAYKGNLVVESNDNISFDEDYGDVTPTFEIRDNDVAPPVRPDISLTIQNEAQVDETGEINASTSSEAVDTRPFSQEIEVGPNIALTTQSEAQVDETGEINASTSSEAADTRPFSEEMEEYVSESEDEFLDSNTHQKSDDEQNPQESERRFPIRKTRNIVNYKY